MLLSTTAPADLLSVMELRKGCFGINILNKFGSGLLFKIHTVSAVNMATTKKKERKETFLRCLREK